MFNMVADVSERPGLSVRRYLLERHVDVKDLLKAGTDLKGCVIYLNPLNYQVMRKDPEILSTTSYTIDGFYMAGLLGRILFDDFKRIPRQSFDFTSLAPLVLEFCERNKLAVFIAGGTPDELQAAIAVIRARFPGLILAGASHGYVPEAEIAERAVRVKADVAIMSLGNGKQERVAIKAFREWPALYFTAGAFVSQIGRKSSDRYYPNWMDSLNLRWLYRFIREPRVIWRVVRYYPWIWQQIRRDCAGG
jgi:N-acetylglucosaminyldiphosphoundecaprenol N-acetyl-beta-D-mannosaminyltransferase